MKEAKNFVSSVSAADYKEFKRWWRISALSCTACIIGILLFQMPSLYSWLQLRAEHQALAKNTAQFEQQLTQKRTLKDERLHLDAKIVRLERYQNQYKNPIHHLKSVQKHFAHHNAQIQSLKLQGKALELTSTTQGQQSAIALARALSSDPLFTAIDLVWLKQNNTKETSCLMKGVCVYQR